MGGAPRIIRKVIETPKKIVQRAVGGGSPPADTSPVSQRRVEVAKQTEPTKQKDAQKKQKRNTNRTKQIM